MLKNSEKILKKRKNYKTAIQLGIKSCLSKLKPDFMPLVQRVKKLGCWGSSVGRGPG